MLDEDLTNLQREWPLSLRDRQLLCQAITVMLEGCDSVSDLTEESELRRLRAQLAAAAPCPKL